MSVTGWVTMRVDILYLRYIMKASSGQIKFYTYLGWENGQASIVQSNDSLRLINSQDVNDWMDDHNKV